MNANCRTLCGACLLFANAIQFVPGAALAAEPAPAGDKVRVYVGTYTGQVSKGIYYLDLDVASGALIARGLAAETASPSFLAVHPSRPWLYAVNEIGEFEGKRTGTVSGFAIEPGSGKLTPLNRQPTGGADPCHLSLSADGKHLLVANYSGGSVAVLPVQDDGRLGEASVLQHRGSGPDKRRQEGPHAHAIGPDPAGRYVLAADLGLDKILVYRLDAAKGVLTPNDPPAASVAPGAGPRHFAFHPRDPFVYVVNEMASTVTAFKYDAERGALSELQTLSTLPEGFQGASTTAEIVMHPSGKFLYGSNRGHDSIAAFSVGSDGRLKALGQEPTQGKTPRNFAIDPSGAWLIAANQSTNSLVVFRVTDSGRLEPTRTVVRVPAPVCVLFAAGR